MPGEEQALSAVLSTRRDARDQRDQLRDRLCKGARYPGQPSQYTLRVQGSCVPTDPELRASLRASPSAKKTVRPAAARSRAAAAELERLEEFIVKLYPQLSTTDMDGQRRLSTAQLFRALRLFHAMASDSMREQYPDFLDRYNAAVQQQQLGAAPPSRPVPRYLVLLMLLSHLRASAGVEIQRPASPAQKPRRQRAVKDNSSSSSNSSAASPPGSLRGMIKQHAKQHAEQQKQKAKLEAKQQVKTEAV